MAKIAGYLTPAMLRRAFFFSLAAACTAPGLLQAAQPPVKPPALSQAGKVDAQEAAKILEQFRQSGVPGQYYLEFELVALPHRGEEQTFQGRYWGARNEQGAITRVELTDAGGTKHRLLLQNGEQGAVWRLAAGKVARLGTSELFQPLIPGVEVTPFDVQMPFLYWPEAKLEKIDRAYGRPANVFFFSAPPSFAGGELAAARGYLDTQYNALTKTELMDGTSRVLKTFSLLGFKRVQDQYLPKSADYRNERTRNKTRLVVTAAAVKLDLPTATFDPASLTRDAELPARTKILPLE